MEYFQPNIFPYKKESNKETNKSSTLKNNTIIN